MSGIKILFLKVFLRFMGLAQGQRYKYSQEYEDNFRFMDWREKLWWGYKALIRQIELAEKGKGIEEYFAGQDLDFAPEAAFQAEKVVTLTAGGDLSCSEVITPQSTVNLWKDVEDFYFSGDIVCANLESPLDPLKPAVGVPRVCLTAPRLNTSPEMFERYTPDVRGVNFFSTANNHSMDMGEAGIVATLDFLDSRGYPHVGTSRNPDEEQDIPIVERNGIRIAFLAYTYCLNGYDTLPGKEYMVNLIRLNKPDSDLCIVKRHVKAAHEKRADIIVAMLHWSVEFETYPIQNVITMGHRVLEECGVDILLGSHAHVAQPMEKYHFVDPCTEQEKDGFIIYSLGELVSYNAFSKNSRLAALLKLTIAKGREAGVCRTRLIDVKMMPIYTWVHKLKNGEWEYRLLNFVKELGNIEQRCTQHGFSSREIKEFNRLKELLYHRLLPKDHTGVIAE